MAFLTSPDGTADQLDQCVAGFNRAGFGTGLVGIARAVHFTGRNARKPDMWTFRAPDRAVTIPDSCWGAGEGLTGRDYSSGSE